LSMKDHAKGLRIARPCARQELRVIRGVLHFDR
jgi:hypothetical protein